MRVASVWPAASVSATGGLGGGGGEGGLGGGGGCGEGGGEGGGLGICSRVNSSEIVSVLASSSSSGCALHVTSRKYS